MSLKVPKTKSHVCNAQFLKRFMLLLSIFLFHAFSLAENVSIEGLDAPEIEQNIVLFINDVNAPVSEYDLDDYIQKVTAQAQKAVQAFGYYQAQIKVMPVAFAGADTQLKLQVTLNTPTLVKNVIIASDVPDALINAKILTDSDKRLKNQGDIPTQILSILAKLKAMQGHPLDHSQYDSLKSQLTSFALLYGYFDFRFVLHKLLIIPSADGASTHATVHWIFTLGQRYRFGEITFLQNTRGHELAENVKPFESGELFDQGKIGKYTIDLASTGYFDTAIARANAGKAKNGQVPVELILKPKPKDLYKVGIGFSTDTRARLSLDWERPWVNLKGHSLGASLYLSEPRKSISVDYRIPKANPLNDFLNYRVSYIETQENQTLSDAISVELLRQWGAKDEQDWDKIGFLKVEQESFVQGLQARQTTRLVMPGVTFNRTRKKGDIFVNWGDRQQLTLQGASKDLLSDIDFFKVLAKTKWIREYGIHRFTLRADAGAIITNDFARVPSSQRFFAGGDQSIRGFRLNEVTEINFQDIDGERVREFIGGRYLAVGSAEYAFKVADKWRAAVFLDAGSANEDFASDIATGVGLGAHWLSPIGNVQLYLARGNSSFENRWRFHIIIGPGL